jgi:CheY-like chemotaxis protein
MTAPRGKIISVEDSDTDFMALQIALEASGVDAELQRFANGSAAMDELAASCPLVSKASLILLDLNLPGVDGRQVLKAVRDNDPQREVPVIVLSTSSHPRDIEYCQRAGANAYVVKPLELDDWERKIGPLADYWLRYTLQRNKQDAHPDGQFMPCRATFECGKSGHLEQLRRAIEGEIIPRLLLAHGVANTEVAPGAGNPKRLATDEVEELARLALRQDVAAATAMIESMHSRGVTLEMIFQSHVAPAARLVGDFWKADMCSCVEFERAFTCLQELLASLNPSLVPGETMH